MKKTMKEQPLTDGAHIPESLYLDLLKKSLTRYLFAETYQPMRPIKPLLARALFAPLRKLLSASGLEVVRRFHYDPTKRAEGRDWPAEAETMIGLKRLDNLQYCITEVLRQSVPGDLIETGAWRGGATILMRAVLKAYGDESRRVWVADSFQGLPKPDAKRYPADRGDSHWAWSHLAVPLDEVKRNFFRMVFSTNGCASWQAGSATPCPQRPLNGWPYSDWMVTCMNQLWTPCVFSIPSFP